MPLTRVKIVLVIVALLLGGGAIYVWNAAGRQWVEAGHAATSERLPGGNTAKVLIKPERRRAPLPGLPNQRIWKPYGSS